MFLDPNSAPNKADAEVEIRINVEDVHALEAPEGWQVAARRPDLGAVYLRRRQSLARRDIRRLFEEAIRIAYANQGRFHSWMHEPDI